MVNDLCVAAVCLAAGDDPALNLDRAESLVRRAAASGARLVGLPENFAWRGPKARTAAIAEPVPGPITERFAGLARALDVWLLLGSVVEAGAPDGKVFNTSVLLSPAGGIAATYRKVHLFDIDLGEKKIRESSTVAPGDRLSVADVDGWRVGLQICYDVRFAEAAIALRALGADVIAYPSNFTRATGLVHWRPFLVARAVETGCAVVAPAQWGEHPGYGIETHGHALVLDPWGSVLAERAHGDGIAVATLRRDRLEEVRARLPIHAHRRPDVYRA